MAKVSKADKANAVARVCALLEQGGCSIRQACKKEGIALTSLQDWSKETPEIADQYARAREAGMAIDADAIEDLAATKCEDQLEAARIKLMVDTRKWIVSKRLPKVYGDRQHVEHSGAIDLGSRIEQARQRALEGKQ